MIPAREGVRRETRPISQRLVRQNQRKNQFDEMLLDIIRFTSLIAPAPT
jgi:hypothetical protein